MVEAKKELCPSNKLEMKKYPSPKTKEKAYFPHKKDRSLMANPAEKSNSETKCRTIAAAAAPFIIIGGICIAFGWRYVSRAWNRKHRPPHRLARSMSMAALHGGNLALERLVDYHNYHGKPTDIEADMKELKTLLGNEQLPVKELQRVLARLEMSRREDEAIKVLKKALKRAKKEAISLEAYEIEMLLAEMYIYKGDVQKALKCKCLAEDQGDSDARPSLYKAIISLMDQKEQDAEEYWKKFKDIQHQTIPPTFHDEEFIEFKNAVNLLKQDIDAATQLEKQ